MVGKEEGSKKKEKRLYYFLLLFLFIYFVQKFLFEKLTLNQPILIYVFPFSISVIAVFVIKIKNFKNELRQTKKTYLKLANIFGIFLKYIIINFTILGSTFLFAFGIVNKAYANHNPIEFFFEKVIQATEKSRRRSSTVQFYFKGKLNSISTKEANKILISEDEIWQISLSCRKGLFGTYVIENWSIESNRK